MWIGCATRASASLLVAEVSDRRHGRRVLSLPRSAQNGRVTRTTSDQHRQRRQQRHPRQLNRKRRGGQPGSGKATAPALSVRSPRRCAATPDTRSRTARTRGQHGRRVGEHDRRSGQQHRDVAAGRNTMPANTATPPAPPRPSAGLVGLHRGRRHHHQPERGRDSARSLTVAVIVTPSPHRAPMIGHQVHHLIQRVVVAPRHDVDADRAHVAVHEGALQRPHPGDQRVGPSSNGAPSSTSTATTTWPRLRRSISASAKSVSSSVENAMTIAPGGTAARGASVPGVVS